MGTATTSPVSTARDFAICSCLRKGFNEVAGFTDQQRVGEIAIEGVDLANAAQSVIARQELAAYLWNPLVIGWVGSVKSFRLFAHAALPKAKCRQFDSRA